MAAYAVIIRSRAANEDDQGRSSGPAGREILLSRLSEQVTPHELWTLPGGGLDHGEDPREAVVREIYEETGLRAEVGDLARIYSHHMPRAWRLGARVDAHALRIVYVGTVASDAPPPRTTEVGGSTAEAAWLPLGDVLSGVVPTVALVRDALAGEGWQADQHTPDRR